MFGTLYEPGNLLLPTLKQAFRTFSTITSGASSVVVGRTHSPYFLTSPFGEVKLLLNFFMAGRCE